MNNHDRSRRHHYGEEARQDYYSQSSYSAQRVPYPDASSHLHQQNVNLAHFSQAQTSQISQYSEAYVDKYDVVQNNDFHGGIHPMYYQQPQTARNIGSDRRLGRRQESRENNRYGELYDESFVPETRTSTERATPIQTSSSSRSTSRYGSSTTSSSDYEDVNWEENIVSALNGMAGNLKKIGGIHCNQAGPDSTEVQLKLNLPLPVQYMENLDINDGLNNAMASLSPKNCGHMQYRYSQLDDHVVDAEEKFLGTMDHQIQENAVPVYKSLFSNQSESYSDDEDKSEQSESTYEDPRFLSKHDPDPNYKTTAVLQSRAPNAVLLSPAPNSDGIPTQIIVSSQPSGLSSNDSWKLSPYVNEAQEHQNKTATNEIMTTINNNLDVAIRRRSGEKERKEQNENRTSNNRHSLEVKEENEEIIKSESKSKLKTQYFKANDEIPQVISIKNVHESYSDLTVGVRMTGQSRAEEEKLSSAVPAIKTQFSGDEIMGHSKASFQRNSFKNGKGGEDFVRSDPPETNPSSSRSHVGNKTLDAQEAKSFDKDQINGNAKAKSGPSDELHIRDSKRQEQDKLHEEKEKARKRKLERKRREAEAKAAMEARLEEQVEAEIRAAREALKAQKLKEERKRLEAEAKAEEEAIEAKRLQKEKERLEAEEKALEEAKKAKEMEEKRKRIEAEAKAAQEALEAKKLEVEQKQREAEKIAGEEAQKAKKLEEERKRIETETKLAREALDALYAEKMKEEKRQREIKEKKIDEEKRLLEAKAKELEAKRLRDIRKRVEDKIANDKSRKYEERKKIAAQTKTAETRLEGRKSKKEDNRFKPTARGAASGQKGRASLYKVRGFDDYCKSVTSNQSDTNDSISDEDEFNFEEESISTNEDEDSTGSVSYDGVSTSSNSADTRSSDQESDVFTDAISFKEDSDSKEMTNTSDAHSSSTTERLRNKIDIQSESVELKYNSERTPSVYHRFSGEDTVNTADKTIKSYRTRDTSRESFSKPKLATKTHKISASDVLIPNASTLTTLPTFDQGTVHSGQQSLGRFIKSSDESVTSAASYSNQSVRSAKPVALPVAGLPRETEKKDKTENQSRSSILGTIISFLLSLVLRIIFTIIVFLYTWIKHLVITLGEKRQAKLDCTPTQFALQPDQSIRREEIQDRSMDSLIHQNTTQQNQTLYLGYDDPHKEHYSTTMIIKAPTPPLANDSDEVGTCVESIVPDAHCPRIYNGKMATWNITQKSTETSSLSSPPSTSFGILKSAYSALSVTKPEDEKSNWLDQPTIDDEMSYYE